MLLTACGSREAVVILHPITGQDYMPLRAGETIVAPKDGAFVSDYFQKEVMKVQVGK